MKKISFECMKRGTCCRNLLKQRGKLLKGLGLTPRETNLFSPDTISPNLAIGRTKPERIFMFQLNVKDCPHLEGNSCKIYEKRPLKCRAFPYDAGDHSFSLECPVVGSQLGNGEPASCEFSLIEKESGDTLQWYLNKHCKEGIKKNSKLWEFDLSTRIWKMVLELRKLKKKKDIRELKEIRMIILASGLTEKCGK